MKYGLTLGGITVGDNNFSVQVKEVKVEIDMTPEEMKQQGENAVMIIDKVVKILDSMKPGAVPNPFTPDMTH